MTRIIGGVGLIGLLVLLVLVSLQIRPVRPAAAADPLSKQIPADAGVIEGVASVDSVIRLCPSDWAPCQLTATASSFRKGGVNLSWRSNGIPFRGSFLVERSTNWRTWSVISTCQRTPTTATSYYCSDTGLISGATYYYRACAVSSGVRCGRVNLTPVTSVTVP